MMKEVGSLSSLPKEPAVDSGSTASMRYHRPQVLDNARQAALFHHCNRLGPASVSAERMKEKFERLRRSGRRKVEPTLGSFV